MSESPLMVKSKAFALEVIRACRGLREARCESALISRFLRSGTSIGAILHGGIAAASCSPQANTSFFNQFPPIPFGVTRFSSAYFRLRKAFFIIQDKLSLVSPLTISICMLPAYSSFS